MESYDQDSKIVTFNVLADIKIGDYVLQDTTFGEDGIPSNRQPHQVAFPDIMLKAGEFLEIHLIEHGAPKKRTRLINNKFIFNETLRRKIGGVREETGLAVYAGWRHAINKTGDTLTLLKKIEQFDLPSTP